VIVNNATLLLVFIRIIIPSEIPPCIVTFAHLMNPLNPLCSSHPDLQLKIYCLVLFSSEHTLFLQYTQKTYFCMGYGALPGWRNQEQIQYTPDI